MKIMGKKYVVSVDFGALSGRALHAGLESGENVAVVI